MRFDNAILYKITRQVLKKEMTLLLKSLVKMFQILKYSVGLDIDKRFIHACIVKIDIQQKVTIIAQSKFNNTAKGHIDLQNWITKKSKQKEVTLKICVEATGVYHESISLFLHQAGYQISIVLPNKSKQYMKALGLKSKNDKIDARGLAQMGAEQNLDIWQPAAQEYYELKALCRHKERLENMMTDIRNQLESVTHSVFPNDQVINSLEDLMKKLKEQAKDIKKQIEVIVRNTKTDLGQKAELIMSIPGVGPLIAATVLSETNGFAQFHNERQLVSYSGYDVIQNQSGNRKGRTKISKKGNSHIRRLMHIGAWQMVMQDVTHLKNLYERVYERTGIKMKAYVAVQRKLLCIIFALVKKGEKFDSQYNLQSEEITKAEEPQVL